MDKPDTITVSVEVERKVHATGADLYVEIQGDSFVSGTTALKKAREVRDLVGALAQAGLEEQNIEVVGVRAMVSSGIIGKSSSALYRLRVDVASLDRMTDVLGAITSSKNARLTQLYWQYDDLEDLHDEMLGQALRGAQQRAALICETLTHQNLGVHALTETFGDEQQKRARAYTETVLGMADFGSSRNAAVTKEDLGLEVRHAKTVSLEVQITYRVEPARRET